MKKHGSLNRSITFGCVVFLLLISIVLSFANLTLHKNFVYKDYEVYIEDILKYTQAHIDGDDLKECIETKVESEKYKETLLFMDGIIDHYHDVHYFYAILPLNKNETGNVMSVLSAERYHDRYEDTEGNLYLGWISDDEFDLEVVEYMFEAMNSDSIIFFEEKTEWGKDYTGAMPIKDSNGNSIAVLAVDIDISFINSSILEYALVNVIVITVSGLAFILIFLLWSKSHITKPIKLLEESAVSFVDRSSGKKDINALDFKAPEIKVDNEIKSLSDAVTKMTDDMKEYVNNIISAEEKAASMQELANHDALTGLKNKTAYDAEINDINDNKVALVVIDLNNLKKVNDTYGHEKGDISIKKLAYLIKDTFNNSDVYRIGGDEFVVLLKDYDYDHFDELSDKINKHFEKIQKDKSLEPWEKISAALGVAYFKDGDDMTSLFMRADSEMYKRKEEMKKKIK